MAHVKNVAQYILERAGEMTTMKLQKLVYYSQAWHSVWEDSPLFPEEIQAWANGPVSPVLYECHRGMLSINSSLAVGKSALVTTEQRDTIDRVLAHYAQHSGQYLSDLTHAEDPWKNARSDLAPGTPSTRTITVAAMAEYYGSL